MSTQEKPQNDIEKEEKKQSRLMTAIYALVILTAAVNALYVINSIWHIDILQFFKNLFMLKYLPNLGSKASFGLLFLFGLLTSFHCVGMCGGIAISQTIPSSRKDSHSILIPSAMYNLGRVLSYTAIGALVGGLGQIISFTGIWKSLIPILCGILMIIMAVNLLGIFRFLRRFTLPVPKFFAGKVFHGKLSHSPLIAGLFTALMPCGPLQMVQIYALGTKSIIYGALAMFVFSLGTVPLLFTFGILNTLINKKLSGRIIKVSAALVLLLGFVMIQRGLSLAGINIEMPFLKMGGSNPIEYTAKVTGNIQVVDSEAFTDSFPVIVVQKGIPVKWNLHLKKKNYNDCNNAIVVPGLKIEKNLKVGDNFILFTPQKTGTINYTCWMGMIKSKIKVIDKIVGKAGEK